MNRIENWFCASSFWRYVTRRQLLPWLLQSTELGDHVLELGAGPGAATGELRRRTARVTSLEYELAFATQLRARVSGTNAAVVQGDAAALPFRDSTFSSAIAILMLHHMRASQEQDKAFEEIYRVLRPGGVFLALEIPDGWFPRVIHTKSKFVPVQPNSAIARLMTAGFSSVTTASRRGSFRIRALRA